jgi:pimeloyl-ACP methyl ester carboxylesterase
MTQAPNPIPPTGQPQLHRTACVGPALARGQKPRQMAYWDWPVGPGGDPRHVVVCVHGLSRQGRDFDVLARHLQPHARVVCPDVAGRGHSDWLDDPALYQIPTYVGDMLALLAELRAQGAETIDWVGTSMGGLIGMGVSAQPGSGLRRLVLNDVGPAIEPVALERIGTYLGVPLRFDSLQAGADYLRGISEGFGPHTEAEWLALSAPMFREDNGGFVLHYDPRIALPFKALNAEAAREAAAQGEAMLWHIYDHIALPTLVLRGAVSDLLSPATAAAMAQRGPKARCVEFEGVGHAPTLVAPDQVQAVAAFLWGAGTA